MLAALHVSGVDTHHQVTIAGIHNSINQLCLSHFPTELQHNLNYVCVCVCVYIYIFYILLYIFKTTAFNHPPLFYISYSPRLVTFDTTNLEF